MKCKVCDLECNTFMTMKYCNGTHPYERKNEEYAFDHYTFNKGYDRCWEIFMFDGLEIQMHYNNVEEYGDPFDSPFDIMVGKRLKNGSFLKLDISKDSFMSMNFDPKNPQDIINRLSVLKSFY